MNNESEAIVPRIVYERFVNGSVLTEIEYPAGLRVGKHSHANANFCIGLKGTCVERFLRSEREYRPLSVMYLPPEQEHSPDINDRAVKSFSVSVSTEWIKAVDEFSLRPDDWIFCRGGTLANLFVKLYQECKIADEASSIAIESIVFEMLATVSRHQADTNLLG